MCSHPRNHHTHACTGIQTGDAGVVRVLAPYASTIFIRNASSSSSYCFTASSRNPAHERHKRVHARVIAHGNTRVRTLATVHAPMRIRAHAGPQSRLGREYMTPHAMTPQERPPTIARILTDTPGSESSAGLTRWKNSSIFVRTRRVSARTDACARAGVQSDATQPAVHCFAYYDLL